MLLTNVSQIVDDRSSRGGDEGCASGERGEDVAEKGVPRVRGGEQHA